MKATYFRPPAASHAIAVAALTVALLTGALACAGAVWAHAARIANDPTENAVLTEPPPRVSATFSEPMQAQFAAMTVIGPDGDNWSDDEPDVDGAVISIGVRSGAPAGDYTVNYRATSADGHVVSGSWSYRLAAAPDSGGDPATSAVPTPASAPPAADTNSDGMPVWPFFAAASAVIAAGAIWVVRRRP